MGIFDFLRAAPKTSPAKVPTAGVALSFQERNRVGKANVELFRNWAEHSAWIRTAINIRRLQISSASWDIIAFDPEEDYSRPLAGAIRDLFRTPNPRNDSFRSFAEPVVEDILTLDAGVIEKVRGLNGRVVQLWPVDGGKIKVNRLWDGSNPDDPRYFWYPDNFERARFKNDELVYIMANPATYRVVGLAPIETLKLTIDAELNASDYNSRQVTNAAPDGLLDLGEGVRVDQVDKFKAYWESEVAGKGAMAFLGGSRGAKFVPFRPNNRDMQFLEWQVYLVRKIAGVYGLSPQDLGMTFDVNRSTSETQADATEDRGLRPLLTLVEDYLTREIVWDDEFGGPANNLRFKFIRLNMKESLTKGQFNKLALSGVPWKSINEARLEDGMEPLGPEFDKLIMSTATGAVTLEQVPTAADAVSKDKATPPEGQGGKPSKADAGSGSKG